MARQTITKAKRSEYNRRWYENHKEQERERTKRRVSQRLHRVALWKSKGIVLTLDEYDQMVVAQRGLCAICEQPPTRRALSVDHNHKTVKIRALLCDACNKAIGLLQDSVDLCKKAAQYLEHYT